MPDEQEGQERSLAQVLKELGGGSFHREASEALATLVKEMWRVAEAAGGKPKGKLVLTLNLSLDRGIMDLDPSVKVTTPATIRARTIMYPGPDGRLSRNDFRQGALALENARDVSTAPVRDIRSVGTAS
jgi:hypothetical protein